MLRRPDLAAALAAVTVAAITVHMAPSVTALRRVRSVCAPQLAGHGDASHVALTFDDGPNRTSTPFFLAELDRRGVHATFFVLGAELAQMPTLAAEIVAAGHELAVHGWMHQCLVARRPGVVHAELCRTKYLIEDLTGERPRYYRPPYGILTTPAVLAAHRLGLSPRLWTCWGREWRPRSHVDSVLDNLRSGLRPGATVLLHDADTASAPGSWRRALSALPYLLDDCFERGLRVGPLREHGVP